MADKTHIDYLDPDDWDERPEFICKSCGYKTCICKAVCYTAPKRAERRNIPKPSAAIFYGC